MQEKKLVSVIVIAEAAPIELVNNAISSVLGQTYKKLDILVSHFQRPDLSTLQERWKDVSNLRWIESNQGFDLLDKPLKEALGEIIFYKTINPISWFPRHIEHHLELFQWDQKAQWSFSYTELKNLAEKDVPVNVLNWKIDRIPKPENSSLEEFCHLKELKPDWTKCLASTDGGKTSQFVPGLVFEQFKNFRVVVPEEITVQQWLDVKPQQINLGVPVSDQNVNEEVVELTNGQLGIKIEYPTIVGSGQWQQHNDLIYDRIKDLDPLTIKNIAIKRTIGMGDVVLVEPIVRALRKRYSNASVTLFTGKMRSAKDIVPYFKSKVDEIKEIDNEGILTQDYLYQQKGFDLRFDFDLSYESRKNSVYIDAYFLTAGFRDQVKEVDGKLKIINPITVLDKIPELEFNELPKISEKYVSVELAGSGWGGKEWSIEKWNTILAKLRFLGYKVAYTSNQRIGVKNTAESIGGSDYVNENNDFLTMMNYLKYASFHIGADNGAMHVAAALGKKCFIIAGTALPKYTCPSPLVYGVTKKDLPCLHCKGRQYFNDNGQGGITFVTRCENSNEYSCMKDLEIADVEHEFELFYGTL